MNPKITADNPKRRAIAYTRQSSPLQVAHNLESQRRQYGLAGRHSPLRTDCPSREGVTLQDSRFAGRGGTEPAHLHGLLHIRDQTIRALTLANRRLTTAHADYSIPCRSGPLPEHGTSRAAFLSREPPVPIKNVLASVAVKDLDSTVSWYERLFKRSPSRPMPEVADWSFERGGGLQLYQLPERAGSRSFTLIATSVEEQIAQLDKLNIDTSQRTASDRVKTVMITDPDGNHIAFAEPIDSSLAH